MLAIFLAAFIAAHIMIIRDKIGRLFYFLQYAVIISLMAFGVIISTADQLTYNGILAYILVCLIIGVALLIRPGYALLIFVLSYMAYFFAIQLAIPSGQVLVSNRMNGLTIMALGYFLSVVMWRYNRINMIQKRRIQSQQEQLEKVNKELEKLAYFDHLTSLPNRRYFDDIVKGEAALIERKGHESCLVMLDIDFFKRVNDIYGHPAGDSVLIQFGDLLSQNIRKYDTLCRLGGEEFILLLPQTVIVEATDVAEKIRQHIASHPFCIDHDNVYITASFGVAKLVPSADPALIHQYSGADQALYLAKRSGRNCVRVI